MNLGEDAGQTVKHLYMHYIPRRDNDLSKLGFGTAMGKYLKK
jgi:diadenosine tetraphosphate (Ap4A) HIT family hydrolase